MKLLSTLFITCFISACCVNPKDVSLTNEDRKDPPGIPDPRATYIPVEQRQNPVAYDYHYVGCRGNYADQEEQRIVRKILSDVGKSGRDVVLYFHGGLTGQKAMVKGLGKDLLAKVFSQEGIKQKLYPIFVNYDADPIAWESYWAIAKGLLSSSAYKSLESEVGGVVSFPFDQQDSIFNHHLTDGERAQFAALIFGYSEKLENYDPVLELTEDQIETLLDIIGADTLPKAFRENYAGITPHPIDMMTQQLEGTVPFVEDKQYLLDKEIIPSNLDPKLRVLRVLARFSLGTDHGFPATVQEEYLHHFLSGAGQYHWDMVKDHANECFSNGRNGYALIEGLKKLKEENNISVSTLSHSAGSIPTSELIGMLGKRSESSFLDNVVMLMPAVNQAAFKELVIPNKDVFSHLYAYVLTEQHEKDDKVLSKWLYSASLLYAVSSIAENTAYLDKMLLLDQHMKADFPYNKKTFQCVTCEKPKDVWGFFDASLTSNKATFITYPFKGRNVPNNEAPTHGGTKFPWVSQDLAESYFDKLGAKFSSENKN